MGQYLCKVKRAKGPCLLFRYLSIWKRRKSNCQSNQVNFSMQKGLIITPPEMNSKASFLEGGGKMGELIRAYDWQKTPLGSPEDWPQSLKTCVRIMLTSRQSIWIGWGKDLIKLYN